MQPRRVSYNPVSNVLTKNKKVQWMEKYYNAYYGEHFEDGDYDDTYYWPPSVIMDDSNILQLHLATPTHDSIEDAIDEMAEEGTKSALDLCKTSHTEHFGVAYILTSAELVEYMGTDKPNRTQFEEVSQDLFLRTKWT